MITSNQSILDIMSHYAQVLGNDVIAKISRRGDVASEPEAKSLAVFLDAMCEQISADSKNSVVVLRQPIHTRDAEKICEVIENYLESKGYGGVLE